MDSFQPVAIITEVQPTLAVWLLAISFFVTLAVVAVVSKGRKWYELVCLFFVVYLVAAAVGLGISTWILDIIVVDVEVISVR